MPIVSHRIFVKCVAMGGASEQVTESVSTPVTAGTDPPDEVRKTLDFDEENEVSMINDKDDTTAKSLDKKVGHTTD